MPNLKPPVTTVKLALEYRGRILAALPAGARFEPLMTLYLTDNTSPDEIIHAKETGAAIAVKWSGGYVALGVVAMVIAWETASTDGASRRARFGAAVRRELGVRTVFNLLGPLANPAGVSRQLVGIARPAYVPIYADALARGERSLTGKKLRLLNEVPGIAAAGIRDGPLLIVAAAVSPLTDR